MHRQPSIHFERLTKRESHIVGQALRAAADGPFFPDGIFQTLIGLSREQVRRIADEWPLPNLPPEDVMLAVNNSLNWLLSYPHRKHDLWSEWISVDQIAVNEIYNKIRGKCNETPFERMI
jgi:hypothetical protein